MFPCPYRSEQLEAIEKRADKERAEAIALRAEYDQLTERKVRHEVGTQSECDGMQF